MMIAHIAAAKRTLTLTKLYNIHATKIIERFKPLITSDATLLQQTLVEMLIIDI